MHSMINKKASALEKTVTLQGLLTVVMLWEECPRSLFIIICKW